MGQATLRFCLCYFRSFSMCRMKTQGSMLFLYFEVLCFVCCWYILMESWQDSTQPCTKLLAKSVPMRTSCLLGSAPEGKSFLAPLPNSDLSLLLQSLDSLLHTDPSTQKMQPGITQKAQPASPPELGRAFQR
jgi:hypothetical protein